MDLCWFTRWQVDRRFTGESEDRRRVNADSALSSYHHWDDHQDDHWHGVHHGDHCRDQDEEVEDEDHEDDDDCAQLYLRTVLSFNPPSPHSPNTLREKSENVSRLYQGFPPSLPGAWGTACSKKPKRRFFIIVYIS